MPTIEYGSHHTDSGVDAPTLLSSGWTTFSSMTSVDATTSMPRIAHANTPL
jgi:hypothetical protein